MRVRLRPLGWCSLALTVPLLLTSCTIGDLETAPISSSTQSTSTVTITSHLNPGSGDPRPGAQPEAGHGVEPEGASISAGSGELNGALQAAVEQTTLVFAGTAGIAVSDGSTEFMAGDTGPAASWSTIKVPIAIAALRQDPQQAANATAAIQWSDNPAAEALWLSLGTPEQASGATGAVLAEGGSGTAVNAVRSRSEFSTFGQTMWTPTDQARFAANLECIPGAAPVLESMSMVEASQTWGIGQLPNARFKGGWGPDPDGSYMARQFGLSTDPETGQMVALAIIVRPGSGTFSDAQAMASTLISHIQDELSLAPEASCL